MARDRRPDCDPVPGLGELSLYDYIEKVSPDLRAPRHLAPLVEALETAPGGGHRICVGIPVQHGKTTTVLHAVPRWLVNNPKLHIMYATYSQAFSQRQSRVMRRLALESGVVLSDDHNRIDEWRTDVGGGLLATSVDGPATGHKAHVVIVDDPFKGREQAESAAYRQLVDDWFRDVILTRLPPGASVFVIMSRWHDDDLTGRLIKRGWRYIRLPAIDDDGRALCPDGPDPAEPRDLAFLEKAREDVGEYGWASLYQGEPRPRTGSLFKEPRFYDPAHLPQGMRIFHGIDLAYSSGARSDFAAAVALGEHEGKFYVLDVCRWQDKLSVVESGLRFFCGKRPGVENASYVAGTEKGPIDLMAHRGLFIQPLPARWSKYVRSQPCADAWNAGKIMVPNDALWLEAFVTEVCNFSGTANDLHDDQIDAMVSAYDMLAMTVEVPGGKFFVGRRRM